MRWAKPYKSDILFAFFHDFRGVRAHLGAILGLGFFPEVDQKCSKLVPGASGVRNRGEGSDLGCKMEGKGPTWGAKWREKRAIWEHGGGTGACALDTPRQALACR